jgi:hypothetical protein
MYNYSNLSNKELFKLIAGKDIGGIEFIYDKYSPAIYGVILQKVATRQEADNILSETFVTCFKGQSSPLSFTTMFVYLYNIAIGAIKKRDVLYMVPPEDNIHSLKNGFKKFS